MRPDVCLLIASCDKYNDLWSPFFTLKERYWSKCPYPTYLGTESIIEPALDFNFTYIHVGPHASWTSQMRSVLGKLPYKYILLSLEDFFLRRGVDQSQLDEAFNWLLENEHASSLRLNPLPTPNLYYEKAPLGIGEYSVNQRYKVSTQAGFWRKERLLQLLDGERSPWEFEQQPNQVASAQRHFGSRLPLLPYRGLITHHVVEKGCWIPHEYWYFRLRGVLHSTRKRKILGVSSYLKFISKVLARRALDQILKRR